MSQACQVFHVRNGHDPNCIVVAKTQPQHHFDVPKKETFKEDALQQSDTMALLNASMYEEDRDEVHTYKRDDMNDLVTEANNLNQPREFDGYESENDINHDDNESGVDPTNKDAHSINDDDIV